MSNLTTTCGKCGALYFWGNDTPGQRMPDCPKCGYNPTNVGNTSDVKNLLKQLSSEDYVTRNNSAVALGDLKEKSAVDPLLSMLTPEEIDRCPGVVRALGEIGDILAVNPLIELLLQERDILKYAEKSVIRALAKIGTEASLKAIFNKLHLLLPIDIPDTLTAFVNLGNPAKAFLEEAIKIYKDDDMLIVEL